MCFYNHGRFTNWTISRLINCVFFDISVNNVRSNTRICPFELDFETNAHEYFKREERTVCTGWFPTFDRQPTREWVEVLPNVEVVARANSLSLETAYFFYSFIRQSAANVCFYDTTVHISVSKCVNVRFWTFVFVYRSLYFRV